MPKNKKVGKKDAAIMRAVAGAVMQQAKKKKVQGRGAYAYGRGKYKLGKSLGGALGGMLGAAMGSRELGSMAGRAIGGGIQRKVKGRGAYRTNDLVNGSSPSALIPSFGTPDENGNIRIRHKEYIGDIFSPTVPANYTLQTFALNPALAGVFPWLSQTAANYDEYEFQGLIFTYNPVISDSSNSGAMGTVMLATVYNAGATPFISKQQMLEYSGAVSARICDTIVHGVECDPKKNGGSAIEYTRAGQIPAGQDIKTYDLGVFSIATSGVASTSFPAGTQLGELWVSYDVILRKPKFWDNLGYSILTDVFVGTVGGTITIPLGTAPLKSGQNSLGGTLSKAISSTYIFPDNFAGYVMVEMVLNATLSSTFVDTSVALNGNITAADFFYIGAGTNTSTQRSDSTAANKSSIITKYMRVSQASTSNGNYIILTPASLTGTINYCQLFVSEINPLMGVPNSVGGALSNYVAV